MQRHFIFLHFVLKQFIEVKSFIVYKNSNSRKKKLRLSKLSSRSLIYLPRSGFSKSMFGGEVEVKVSLWAK